MAEENQDSSSGAKKRKLSDCVSKYKKNYFNIESAEWHAKRKSKEIIDQPQTFSHITKINIMPPTALCWKLGRARLKKLDPSTSQSPTPTLTKHFLTVLKKILW